MLTSGYNALLQKPPYLLRSLLNSYPELFDIDIVATEGEGHPRKAKVHISASDRNTERSMVSRHNYLMRLALHADEP